MPLSDRFIRFYYNSNKGHWAVDAQPETDLGDVAQDLLDLSKESGHIIGCEFNGVTLWAYPYTTVQLMLLRYQSDLGIPELDRDAEEGPSNPNAKADECIGGALDGFVEVCILNKWLDSTHAELREVMGDMLRKFGDLYAEVKS